MALRKVRSNLDRLFDKSLTDLIRGIRNNKDNEARYIAACIDEIKMELRQDSTYVKANAIEKLAYLQMLGYDISWASFNIIEVMASTKYTEKRIGYLAAAQSFHDDTDVLMLTTNLIRKDLNSSNMYDAGVALGGLACFVTHDLARDLASDIVNLLSSSRPYVRKRAVLLLFKVFLKYPDALRPTFARLKEKLEDPDPGVQSAAVNVICELARKNPKNYLTLAPVFFKLMTTSSNNWMLIKIIKLFGALVPLEKRLGRKLLEPLTNLINSTSAMSLLYECINTVIAVLISFTSGAEPGAHAPSIQLCVQKLGVLIEDSDQNLKYLGLLAMGRILQTHPKAVQAHKDILLKCLDDKDESIRLRSLDLLYGMVSKKNIMEIVKKLMEHVEHAEGSHYRDELLSRIISICSYNNYQYISNFEWYISVLVELTKVEGTKHGANIAEQIQDVTVRVESIRHFSVSQMALLVENAPMLLAGSVQQRSNISEVLLAAAWICGEYNQHVRNVPSVLEAMLKARTSVMPGHILSVYVQNIGKLYAVLMAKAEQEEDWDAVESLDNLMLSKLPQFELAEHLEAQERACTLMGVVRIAESLHAKRETIGSEVTKLFEGELNPVAAKAQRKVPVPEGLDLDANFGEEWVESASESSEDETEKHFGQPRVRSEFSSFGPGPRYESDEEPAVEALGKKKHKNKPQVSTELSPEEIGRRREQREREIQSNPYYVKGNATVPKKPVKILPLEREDPQEKIDIQSPLEIPGVVGLSRYMEQQTSTLSWKKAKKEKHGKKGKKKRTASSSSDEQLTIVHRVNRADGEMPENAKSTDDEADDNMNGLSDEFKALDVNLDEPLRPHEIVRGPQAYVRSTAAARSLAEPLQPRAPTIQAPARPLDLGEKPRKISKKKKKTETAGTEEKKKKVKKSTKNNGVPASTLTLSADTKHATVVDPLNMDDWLNDVPSTTTMKEKKTKKKKKTLTPAREAYEEPSGVCTPSNPNADVNHSQAGPLEPTVAVLPLARSEHLNAEYHLSAESVSECLVSISLSNLSQHELKNIEIDVCDTLNAQLCANGDSVCGPRSIAPLASASYSFKISINSINTSQRLRGTIAYFVQEEDGQHEDKMDFKLEVPTVTFLTPISITKDAFSVLLSGDEIDHSSSQTSHTQISFKQMVSRIVNRGHFSVVEEDTPNGKALLFANTLGGLPIAILARRNEEGVHLTGKAGDKELVNSVVTDLSRMCSQE